MEQKKFPGLALVEEELNRSLDLLQTWLNCRINAAQIISKKILLLFKDDTKEKRLLMLPATLMGESSGWDYNQIANKFPKDLTLLDCIILTGISIAQNPTTNNEPSWEQVVVKMIDIRNIINPGENFAIECERVSKLTEGIILIRHFNASTQTNIHVFSAKFDFEKSIPKV